MLANADIIGVHWSIRGLTADATCPALTGEPWDVYFELHGYNDIYNAVNYIKIVTWTITTAIGVHWSIRGLTADATCPALTGEPWDVCFE